MNNIPYACEIFFNNPPPAINGGYCFQNSAGEPASSSFHTL